uniref:DUF4708 domain-containing protein n=1 Tax=Amphiprion percula TaxID=161767 RepID=A0A3P8RYP4_AMPPE
MSGGIQQSLFFLGLPDLKKLVCVTLSLQYEDEEPRSKQIKTCSLMCVCCVSVYCVSPGVLQCCVSFSLVTRLSPSWNKAGRYLISGTSSLIGEIISISHQLPRDGPFRSYRELQNHWNHLYGYRLPELPEQEVVYCSIYFRLVGQKLFTYPLSCIRLQPVQRCPGLDLQGALASFQTDIRARLLTVCGFPARLSSKPCFHTVGLKTAASLQVLDVGQINLSTSTRPVLSQLPAPPPAQPRRPSFGSQPPAWTPVSQQGGAVRHGSGFQSRATQAFLPLFQPASSLTSSSSSSGLPPPPPPPVNPPPKLVPIFRNKTPSRHVNVALLRLQEQREQLSRAAPRVTLPAVGKKTPTAPPLPPSSLPVRPPPTVPNFSRQPKVKRISSLSPASRPKPSLIVALKADVKIKPESGSRTSQQVAKETQEKAKERQPATQPVTSADVSNVNTSSSSKKVSPVGELRTKNYHKNSILAQKSQIITKPAKITPNRAKTTLKGSNMPTNTSKITTKSTQITRRTETTAKQVKLQQKLKFGTKSLQNYPKKSQNYPEKFKYASKNMQNHHKNGQIYHRKEQNYHKTGEIASKLKFGTKNTQNNRKTSQNHLKKP